MSDEILRDIASTLREQLKWSRFQGIQQLKSVLSTTLDTDQKKLIYQLSSGENGGVEIGKIVGTSDRTVRRCWDQWAKLGIVETVKVRGGDRYRRLFDLEEFGISLPQANLSSKSEDTQRIEGEPSS